MRAVVLYRPRSEHLGVVESFIRDFKRFKNKEIEKISLDTREGADLAQLYGITQYPAILVTGPDGSLLKAWQGPAMPLIDEVAAYAQ